MFSSIVVGTDGSPSALAAVQKAAELAKLCGAQLHVVTAYRPIAELVFNPEALPVDIGSLVSPEKDAAQICEEAAAKAAEGVKVTTHACPGNPADALIEVAEREKADVIIVGNRGMRGKRRILGSVPNSVAHHAPCTVMIVSTT
jgi:nucleotide-binding universal stress UspA family protein